MNLFNKIKDLSIYSPISGHIIPLSEIKDEVFSQALMGPGCGIIPTDGQVLAPFDGQVKFVFPTKHAFGLMSSSGVELLIHIGIDTVNLGGEPFKVFIKSNQRIKKGQKLLDFDLQTLIGMNVDPTVILILTDASQLTLNQIVAQTIKSGDLLIEISKAN
jgi:glucose-specific phosphotransferase system IIA component